MLQLETFSQYLRTCYLRNRNKAGKVRPVAPAKVNNGNPSNNEALTFPATPLVELGQVLRVMPAVTALLTGSGGGGTRAPNTRPTGEKKDQDPRPTAPAEPRGLPRREKERDIVQGAP